MSPEREPMENDSNSRTAEELEQQTVDVYVERALHGPVFRMSYEHTHTYCEIFYLKSGTCTYTVNQGQWHLEAGDLFIVAAGDPHSTRYEGKTSCERIIVFCKSDVLAGMMRGDPTEVQQALERSCKVILNAETRTMVEALLDQMLLENDLPRKYSEQVLELESLHLVLLLLRNGIFSHETMSPKEGYMAMPILNSAPMVLSHRATSGNSMVINSAQQASSTTLVKNIAPANTELVCRQIARSSTRRMPTARYPTHSAVACLRFCLKEWKNAGMSWPSCPRAIFKVT